MIKYLLTLILVSIITHFEFFNFGNILFFSDWTHWNNFAVKDLLNFGFGGWISYFGFGGDNIQYNFNIFKSIWGLVGDYEVGTKLTFFIPISLLGFLSPFFLIKYYTKNNLVSFLISLFYGFNTYFLVRQTAHLPIAFVFSFTPLLFLFFDKFLKDLKQKDFLIFTFIYFISLCYEIRIVYIITILLIIYFFFFGIKNIKNKILYIYLFIFVLLQIFLNLFWLLPTILSSGDTISSVANRGLFGNNLFNILYSLTVFDQSWTGLVPDDNFIPQKIPFYFWFYPILVIFSLLFIKKQNEVGKRLMLFGLTISLLGIILTKQSAEPFTGLYLWLYNNFPGFNLFREASKFFIITILGYTIILGVFLDYLYKDYKKIFSFVGVIIILISLIIAKPLITKEIGTLFVPKIEPKEYIILNNYIINQNENFKTLWFPNSSQWAHFENKKPKISMTSIIDSEYKEFTKTPIEFRNSQYYSSFLFEPISDKLLDISGVKYLIVPLKDKQDDFFKFYGSTQEQYYKKLKKFKFLKELKLKGIEEVKIFENPGYLGFIFSSNGNIKKENLAKLEYKTLNYIQSNPSHYTLKINLKGKETINLSQKKNKNWNLVVGNFEWSNFITGNPFLIKKEEKSLDFINSWTVSKSEIINYVNQSYKLELQKEGYPKQLTNKKLDYKYYTLNPDGSIDAELTLYFKPQSYFYLGLIISGSTLILLMGYLGINGIIRRSPLNSPLIRGRGYSQK